RDARRVGGGGADARRAGGGGGWGFGGAGACSRRDGDLAGVFGGETVHEDEGVGGGQRDLDDVDAVSRVRLRHRRCRLGGILADDADDGALDQFGHEIFFRHGERGSKC